MEGDSVEFQIVQGPKDPSGANATKRKSGWVFPEATAPTLALKSKNLNRLSGVNTKNCQALTTFQFTTRSKNRRLVLLSVVASRSKRHDHAAEVLVSVRCNAILFMGSCMDLKKLAVCGFLAGAFSLASCSGPPSIKGNSSQGSGAALLVALRATPLPPPVNMNVLSFSATIVGLSLTPSTGGSVNIPLNSAFYQVDFTRLQTDSAFLALSAAIPAGTYTNMVVSLSNPAVTYCTQTHGMAGCAAGSIITLAGGPATPIIAGAPFPLVITDGQSTGLAVNVNIAKALTSNAQTQAITSVDLGAADVLTAMILPPASSTLPSRTLDFI